MNAMKKLMRGAAVMTAALAANLCTVAQEAAKPSFWWDVDFSTVFDNREGDSKYTDTRTYFQTQLAPEIGAQFKSAGATHRIAGGAVWTQPIGSEWDGHRISPTLYYCYEGHRGLSASIGMFGRNQLIRPLPNYIWSDSVYYCQRNIRGAMIQYQSDRGFFEALLDWRGMQSRSRREAFNIIAQGEWRHRSFTAGGLAMMNHLARSAEATDDQHVVDNFIVNPYVGYRGAGNNIAGHIHLGMLASLSRDRGESAWIERAGLWLEGAVAWRWLEAKNTLYAGGKLFPLYSRYGSLLEQGEPYYASKWYDRLSLAANLVSTSRVALKASVDFNLAKNNFTFYQRLLLSVSLGSSGRRPRIVF